MVKKPIPFLKPIEVVDAETAEQAKQVDARANCYGLPVSERAKQEKDPEKRAAIIREDNDPALVAAWDEFYTASKAAFRIVEFCTLNQKEITNRQRKSLRKNCQRADQLLDQWGDRLVRVPAQTGA